MAGNLTPASLPSLGAWIEVLSTQPDEYYTYCRSLRWERGLKFYNRRTRGGRTKSLPSLGAWIEVVNYGRQIIYQSRRSLRWERGLKLSYNHLH